MPEERRWCEGAGEVMTFLFNLEIDLAADYITETVSRSSGDLQIEKHLVAPRTIANMPCGPQKLTSLTPMT